MMAFLLLMQSSMPFALLANAQENDTQMVEVQAIEEIQESNDEIEEVEESTLPLVQGESEVENEEVEEEENTLPLVQDESEVEEQEQDIEDVLIEHSASVYSMEPQAVEPYSVDTQLGYTATYDISKEISSADDARISLDGEKIIITLGDGNYLITGNANASTANKTLTIAIAKNATVNLTLEEVTLGALRIGTTVSSHYSTYRNLINIQEGANVTLSLEGTNTLSLSSYDKHKAAIRVAPTAQLTIQDGTGEGTGNLSVTSENYGAAIGGNGSDVSYDEVESNGMITILSGVIDATNSNYGIAIGAGAGTGNPSYGSASNGDIIISGGQVTAKGNQAVAIGSGVELNNTEAEGTGTITIDGDAKVTATTSASVSIGGIGGTGGKILIEGNAEVTAQGIGYRQGDNEIIIQGNATVESTTTSTAVAIGGGIDFGSITIAGNANVTAEADKYAAIGASFATGTVHATGSITINTTGIVTATGGEHGAGIGTTGSASADDSYTSEVIIRIDNGTVNATGGSYSAGIGGGRRVTDSNESSGITISGGTVTATGGTNGAGIGSGEYGSTNVTIIGGTVTATGSDGADIGGGSATTSYYSGIVTISGGMVTATTNGIGRGARNTDSELNFSTGESGSAFIRTSFLGIQRADISKYEGIFFVDGFGDDYRDSAITSENAAIFVVRGTQTLSQNMEIESGKTLTIDENHQLIIPQGIIVTNKGTLTVNRELAITGEGTLSGNGTFQMVSDVISDSMITLALGLPTSYAGTAYALSDYVKIVIPTDELSATIMGQVFSGRYDLVVNENGNVTGWTRTLTRNGESSEVFQNAGTYKIIYTKDSAPTIWASTTYTISPTNISSATLRANYEELFYGEMLSLESQGLGVQYEDGNYQPVDGSIFIYDTVENGDDILLGEVNTADATQVAWLYITTLDIGTHSLYAVFVPDDENYKVEGIRSNSLEITIKKTRLVVTDGESTQSSTYDGTQKEYKPFKVTSELTYEEITDYTILYKLTSNRNGSYSETPPTMVDAGTYALDYLIQREGYEDSYGNVSYTIFPETNHVIPQYSTISVSYTGVAQDPEFSWTNSDTVTNFDNAVTIVYSADPITEDNKGSSTITYKDAGTYTIYYQISAQNHTDYTGSFTFTITEIEVTKVYNHLYDYNILSGDVYFEEPTFQADGIDSENITGTISYSYSEGGISETSYEDFLDKMNQLTLETDSVVEVYYRFSTDGNYKGNISGTMYMTVVDIAFSGTDSVIEVKDTSIYGDTLEDIFYHIDFSELKAATGEEVIEGDFTLWVGGTLYNASTILPVGEDVPYEIRFTSRDKRFENMVVIQGNVSVLPRELNLEWSDTELVYNGLEQAPTVTITNLVGEDSVDISVVVTEAEHINVGTYTATAVLDGIYDNYKFPVDESTQTGFTILQAATDFEKPLADTTVIYGDILEVIVTPQITEIGMPLTFSFLAPIAPAAEQMALYMGETEITPESSDDNTQNLTDSNGNNTDVDNDTNHDMDYEVDTDASEESGSGISGSTAVAVGVAAVGIGASVAVGVSTAAETSAAAGASAAARSTTSAGAASKGLLSKLKQLIFKLKK